MTSHRYHVQVVMQDLPPAEALNQVFDNLRHLECVMGELFGRITQRIRDDRAKLQSICARVSSAQTKIAQIASNQSKVTTVYSTTKYPASKVR